MNLKRSWAITDDVSSTVVLLTCLMLLVAVISLVGEYRRAGRLSGATLVSGLVATAFLCAAVLRPVSIEAESSRVGARVVVLVDGARRMLLPSGDGTRRQEALGAVEALKQAMPEARLRVLEFGDGVPELLGEGEVPPPRAEFSDLSRALNWLENEPGERPQAVVVISDGRLSQPSEGAPEAELKESLGAWGVPLHTVAVGDRAPRDASVRNVSGAGAAVAHQRLALTVEVGCTGGLACDAVPVVVREYRDSVEPAPLASGTVAVRDGVGQVELEVTLERAGTRVLEVAIEAPNGDEIPENDQRFMTFAVARDRVRLLHLAGRPTYDVRALRTWLKSDESVDVVAFFILRGTSDDVSAPPSELALIKFPVDELFTEHLPSFDAVILQDIDAKKYELDKYLGRLSEYVQGGGGLIMVGGPSSFAGGQYAGTPLDDVLPVEQPREKEAFTSTPFVPRYTRAGTVAAITRPLRDLIGTELPSMPGANILGGVRPGGFVLWEHPTRSLPSGEPMPVLALREAGDGRTIALGVDATHQLAFSPMAAAADGRGFGALWDGLLGWLMRDPRYEAARVELVAPCVAGEAAALRVSRLPTMTGDVVVRVEPLSAQAVPIKMPTVHMGEDLTVDVPLPPLGPGGYAAKVAIGAAPASRYDFSCDTGGRAFADTRPDHQLLEKIASAAGGQSVTAATIRELPEPGESIVSAQRHVLPLLPAWLWTLAASLALGAHWFVRRASGLA